MKSMYLAAAAAVSLLSAIPASAATIVLSNQTTNNDVPFYTVDLTFTLPTGFTNAVLTTSSYFADDSTVAQLNGQTFTNAGINGPGAGSFSFDGATFQPFTFTNGNGANTDSIATGFVAGVNTLRLFVNNTNNGIIGGAFTGGPSQVGYDGTVTFAAVPEPTTWALMIGGVGMVGGAMRRRRMTTRVTFA